MSGYSPGSLQKAILGSKSSEINNDLDSLFKNSAGPAQVPNKSFNVKNKVKNFAVDNNNEPVLCKKIHSRKNTNHNSHIEIMDGICEELSRSKELESKKKSIEENYELKVMKKKVSSDTDKEMNLNSEEHLKRKNSTRDSKSQKKVKITEYNSNLSDSDKRSGKNINLNEDANTQQDEFEKDSKTMNNNDNAQHKNELPKSIKKDDTERMLRTIFVGNLPVSVVQKTNHKKLKTLFSQFGKIESIRFRSIAFSELIPRKLAFITGKFHPERDVLNAYIVYKESSSVQQAITMNAQIFLGKHLRVDSVANPQNYDRRRTVFIGNLSFDAQEEELWLHFESCGEIENVRIIRDNKTNIGKGFAYVQFKERGSVEFALKLSDAKLYNRKIRVVRCAKRNHVSKLDSYKNKTKIGKMKFEKELIEGIRTNSKCKSESVQKHNKLAKQKVKKVRSRTRS